MKDRKHRRGIRTIMTLLIGVVFLMLTGSVLWTGWTLTGRFRDQTFTTPETVPARPVAIVFGAGYWPSGTLSNVLKDRLDAAIHLYEARRVEKLLFSGDNRVVEYNEPAKMLEYALSQGIPREDIVLDYAGRRTYDTCYRARDIFMVEEVVLVTQAYHLPRALFVCQGLGLDAVGYKADRLSYARHGWYRLRELPALWLSWADIHIRKPLPVLGEPLPIFVEQETNAGLGG
ncbi:MAG: YdcF family protein [Anaerolineae bacterium]|nr:YdcF family protein [Anaerolineae bacterium]